MGIHTYYEPRLIPLTGWIGIAAGLCQMGGEGEGEGKLDSEGPLGDM